jgi:DNA-binding FrmR family transcriptional regulator
MQVYVLTSQVQKAKEEKGLAIDDQQRLLNRISTLELQVEQLKKMQGESEHSEKVAIRRLESQEASWVQQSEQAALEKTQLAGTLASKLEDALVTCGQLTATQQQLAAAQDSISRLQLELVQANAFGEKQEKANRSLVATIDLMMT